MVNELFCICCERDPDHADQLKRIDAAVTNGVDVHQSDKNGVTALHHAVRFRNPMAVQALIRHGTGVNRCCRRSGSTPLHRAVCNTGAPGTAGRTDAVREIIRILISAGADTTIANKSGKTPRDYVTDASLLVLLDAKHKA
ncbi:Ankyrin repeats (3 copies) [Rubripirellula tenax]|uniref:Ankyrin repeats (3 copies) n=1 Tax=Rubripirellula tenax TaxID=2528015 RepID=A0A5C6F2T5_9BACT|nr:ankyrin repeat domain-containing protein [Rubripirellula tenax]TWU54346.1 Ankyrin repeats (3 copies) [Rubripirellula tenax]